MSLAQVLFPSPTNQGFDEWAWAHFQHHLAIARAVLQVKKVELIVPSIFPINIANIQVWLQNHQGLHNAQNALLGIQGNDLSSLNWTDEKQREGFFYLNFVEHRSAGQNVGVPI